MPVSNFSPCETDSKFHERLAARRLLSPDKIHINFANYFEQVDHRSEIFIMTNTAVHVLTGPALQVVRTSFLGPRPRFSPPPGFKHVTYGGILTYARGFEKG